MKINKSSLLHLIPITLFFVLISVFFAPLYSGKTLVQSDNVQLTGVNKEISDYKENGEQIHWNPREFSGVPLMMSSEYNPFKIMNNLFFYGLFPKPIMMVFALFLGFYVLMLVNGASKWVAGIGAMAYSLASFNIISVEVGHDNKVIAMAFMAPVLAGIILAYRGELLKGGVLTMISAGFQLYYGHIQITYYLLIMVLAYLVVVVYKTTKSKDWNLFGKATGVLAVATLIAIGCNFTKLYSTIEYSDYSTRGGSELTKQGNNVSNDGLSKDYALSWSNGKMETFTLMFPYFHGGASGESIDRNSEVYQALSARGVDAGTVANVTSNVPLYWGSQPFTGGPIYFGITVCFLFILSLFIIKSEIKYWALVLIVLSLLLAMGKNLEWFTDIFFYYVPLYNKFRSVTMILSVAQLLVPFLGFMALDVLIKKSDRLNIASKNVLISVGVVAGIGVFFYLFKNAFFDFQGLNDAAYGFPDWLLTALQMDRKDLFNSSLLRSIIFTILIGGALWLYTKNIIKMTHLLIACALLILVDLWVVDKRYLGEDDFQTNRRMAQQVFQPSKANQQINQDKSYFRVLNLASANPFSDGLTAYHHYSILGYSAIKMQRYQELIDKYIQSVNESVLGMLNAKYYIVKGQNGPVAQRNSKALGNAWLVDQVSLVDDVDSEYEKLGEIDPANEAIVDQSKFPALSEKTYSAEGSVELKEYHPEKMIYSYMSDESQFAVFSEIYYAPGWNAYVDGEEVDYVRVNYILRGMELPSGQHQIEFRYEPLSSSFGKYIIIVSSLFLLVFLGVFVRSEVATKKKA